MKKTRQMRIFGYLFSVHTECCSCSDLKPTSVLRSAGNHFYVVLGPLTPVVDLALQTTCLLILSRTILFIFCSLLLPAQPEAGPTTSGSSFPSLSSLSPTHLPSHPLLSKSVHLEIQYFLPRPVTHLDIPVGG